MSATMTHQRVPTFGQLLELAIEIVRDPQLSEPQTLRERAPARHLTLVPEPAGNAASRSGMAYEVACLVMDWQIALGEDGSAFVFETATLFEIAVELVVAQGLWASDALYAQLALMPAGRLTTWDTEFDAWFARYARPRSGRFEALLDWLTTFEQGLSNYIDVIVTPFRLRVDMIEQTFCPTASALVTACGGAPTDAVDRFGLDPYREAGRLVAACGITSSGAFSDGDLPAGVRAEFDALFVEFAIALGDIDLPPLPCLLLAERYQTWFFDVLLPTYLRPGLSPVAEAAYEGAVEWLARLRGTGGCCSSGCRP